MSYRLIHCDQDDRGIVTITLDDPEAKNAVSPEMNQEIVAEIERVENDPSARVLILTGAGRIFCSGGNIKRMVATGKVLEAPTSTIRDEMFPSEVGIRKVVLGLRKLSKPAIAAINGPAVGSGIGLAAGCDIRVMADTARLSWVFVRRGIVPDDASLALVQQLIGYSRAYEWGVAGGTIDAAKAHEYGFVNHVVPADQLMARCRAIATEIIDNSPPLTVQAFKFVLSEATEQSIEESVRLTKQAQDVVSATEDHREALRAYSEKRRPVWKGK